MSLAAYIILAGILATTLGIAFIFIREDRGVEKYSNQKKDKLEMIEETLKILAKKDRNVEDALRQAGLYKKEG